MQVATVFVAVTAVLFYFLYGGQDRERPPVTEHLNAEYDYIIGRENYNIHSLINN